MEAEDYRRKERVALLVSLIMASLSMVSLLVAFSYYCYIRNKVSKRSENQQSKLLLLLFLHSFLFGFFDAIVYMLFYFIYFKNLSYSRNW